MGTVILISIITMGIAIAGMSILSHPSPQKIPVISTDIATVGRSIYLTHNGGDSIQRSDIRIIADGTEVTNSFTRIDGTDWSAFAAGDILAYRVPGIQAMPSSIGIYYNGTGPTLQIQSVSVPASSSPS
jgi:hypothetical protein